MITIMLSSYMATLSIISSVLFLFGVFVFTNSWTVGTSNHKKVLKESLLRYVLPIFLVQSTLITASFWLHHHGKEKLAIAGWILLLTIAFSPIVGAILINLYGFIFRKK